MKTTLPSIVAFILILFAGFNTLAAPIRPIGPVDLTGTVSDLKWNPDKKIKGLPGMSGSAGVDRTVPAHFLVTLKDFEGVDPKTALAMTRYVDWSVFKDEKDNFIPPFIILKINQNDNNYLKQGMFIKVSGYTVRGDEGGTWTYYTKIDILNQSPLTDNIQRYLEASIELTNSGGKMFCAYDIFGTETKKTAKYIYLWTACVEYYVKSGLLRQGAAVSLPVALTVEETSHGDMIKGHKKPVDGEGYGNSIRKIFPPRYQSTIFAHSEEYNRRAGSLLRETERQARVYFHLMPQ